MKCSIDVAIRITHGREQGPLFRIIKSGKSPSCGFRESMSVHCELSGEMYSVELYDTFLLCFSFFFYKNFQFCMHMLVLYSVKAEIAFLRYDCSRSHVWRNVQCNAIHRLLLCFFFVFLFFLFFICIHTPVQCFHWKMFQCFCSIL